MAEAIENVIDDWLIAYFDTQMGRDSDFTSLKLAQPSQTAILRTVEAWRGWTLPALGIANRLVFRAAVMHPSKLDKRIPYILTFVVKGTQSGVIRDARTLLLRAENILRAIPANEYTTLVSDGGERVQRCHLYALQTDGNNGSSRLRIYPNPDDKTGWYCAGDISIQFTTTTT